MFKTVVFSCAFFAMFCKNGWAITDEQRIQMQTKFVEVGNECIKQHPLAAGDLALFKTRVFPESDNAGCFSACVFNKIGIFDDKGALAHVTSIDNARKVFDDEEALKTIELFLNTCVSVNEVHVNDGELGCERAKLAFNCFSENYDKIGFNIAF